MAAKPPQLEFFSLDALTDSMTDALPGKLEDSEDDREIEYGPLKQIRARRRFVQYIIGEKPLWRGRTDLSLTGTGITLPSTIYNGPTTIRVAKAFVTFGVTDVRDDPTRYEELDLRIGAGYWEHAEQNTTPHRTILFRMRDTEGVAQDRRDYVRQKGVWVRIEDAQLIARVPNMWFAVRNNTEYQPLAATRTAARNTLFQRQFDEACGAFDK